VKPGYFKQYAVLCDKEVKVMWACVGTVLGICCRGDMKISRRRCLDIMLTGAFCAPLTEHCVSLVCYCLFYFLVLLYCSNFV